MIELFLFLLFQCKDNVSGAKKKKSVFQITTSAANPTEIIKKQTLLSLSKFIPMVSIQYGVLWGYYTIKYTNKINLIYQHRRTMCLHMEGYWQLKTHKS